MLRATRPGPLSLVAAPPSSPSAPPPPSAAPNAGYWTRLLEGAGIDGLNLFDEEPATQQAADACAAQAFGAQHPQLSDPAQSTSPKDLLDWARLFEGAGIDSPDLLDEEPTTRQTADVPAASRAEPISPEDLLAVARQAQRLPISDAAAICGFSDRFIHELLKTNGLTERGLRAAGDKAAEITRLMRMRHPAVSARKRLDIDGPRLLDIANSSRTMSLRAAAQAHGMGKNIFNYMTLRGLTSTGRNVAGPLADEIDRVMTAQAHRVSRPQMPTPMTPEMLQFVVEAARNQPLATAAQSVGRTLRQIDAYIAPWGLTHAGRWVAGELADALDEALFQRYLAHGGAGAELDGLKLPPIAPPAMRNRQIGETAGSSQNPRRTVSLEVLLAVTQAATSEGSIARACLACGANARTIRDYVGVRGLTVNGQALAGNLAPRIEHHMRTFSKRYSTLPQRDPEPRADDPRAPQPRMPALSVPQPHASAPEPLRDVGAEPSSTLPLAPATDAHAPLVSGHVLPTQGNKRTSIDAIDLVAIARLSVTMSIPDAAARANISEAALHPFLSPFGLTPQGRALAGDYAEEIDRFIASRIEHLSALYRDLQAQGRSFTSLPDDPFVRELMQLAGNPAVALSDAQPTPGEPPTVAAPTDTPSAREFAQPARAAQPDQSNQPEPPEQSKRRVKMRRLETLYDDRTARGHRPAADRARTSSPTQEAAAALLDMMHEAFSSPPDRPITPQLEASTGHGAPDTPPVSKQAPGTTSADVEGLTRRKRKLREPITGVALLAIARSLPTKTSIASASRANNVSSDSLRKYIGHQGLTPRGRRLAGAHANEINALVGAFAKRYPTASRARTSSPAQEAAATLLDMTREEPIPTGQTIRERRAATTAASTPPLASSAASFDADVSRPVMRSMLSASVAPAASQDGVGEPSTSRDAIARGLATDDRTAAGDHANPIGGPLAANEENRPNITGRNLLRVAKAMGRGAPMRKAAKAARDIVAMLRPTRSPSSRSEFMPSEPLAEDSLSATARNDEGQDGAPTEQPPAQQRRDPQ